MSDDEQRQHRDRQPQSGPRVPLSLLGSVGVSGGHQAMQPVDAARTLGQQRGVASRSQPQVHERYEQVAGDDHRERPEERRLRPCVAEQVDDPPQRLPEIGNDGDCPGEKRDHRESFGHAGYRPQVA